MAVRYHRLSRYHEIAAIIARHGFRYLRMKFGVKSGQDWSQAQRLRVVFEDLGPTFVKMGQLLSARPDLIPKEYVDEFSHLQDNVEEFCEVEVREQFAKEMGRQPEDIFISFDFNPIASASIGQVHKATLPGGEKVVVKVQRPRLRQLIDGDIRILRNLEGILQKRTFIGKVCNVDEIIEVFERQIHKELDYLTEAVNTELFHREFADNPEIIVPKVFSDYSTRQILTMEYVEGIRVEEFEKNTYTYEETSKYARNMLAAVFRPLFQRGVFHGDPHPGNIMFQNNFRIVMIDFGIVGRFDRVLRRQVAELMIALAERDISAVMKVIMETGITTRKIHRQYFFEDVAEIVEKANGVTSGGMELGQLINGMIAISIDHGIKMPDSLFILGKTVMISENMARRICPELDIAEVLEPIAADYLTDTLHPEFHTANVYKKLSGISDSIINLPGDISQAIRNFANNDTKITFYHRNLNWLYDMLDVSSSRIAFGLILAALVVGSAVIMHTGRGTLLWGYPVFGTVGFVFSGLLGVLVLVSMLRSGRLK